MGLPGFERNRALYTALTLRSDPLVPRSPLLQFPRVGGRRAASPDMPAVLGLATTAPYRVLRLLRAANREKTGASDLLTPLDDLRGHHVG